MQVTSAEERFNNGFWQNEFSFLDFPTLPAKKYPTFVGKFLASFSKIQTGCPDEQIVGKLFLRKYKTFQYSSLLSENVSDFWQENFGRFVKNAIWVSRGTVWGEKLFLEKLHVPFNRYWTSTQTVWKLWRKFLNTVFEFAFYVSRGRVWKENLKT